MNKFCIVATLLVGGCLQTQNEEASANVATAAEPLAAAATLPGFVMAPERSKFRLGAGVHSDQENGYARSVGDEGVIARGAHGLMASVPNADAPSTKVSFTSKPSDHEQRALSYFAAAGLPQDQLGPVQTNGYYQATDAVTDLMKGAKPTITQSGYYTILSRQVSGIPVSGSYAWVRFNDNDEAVSEEVYWPDLPQGLINEASALSAAKSQVLARLDADTQRRAKDASVVIVHSPFFQNQFESFAAIVVPGEADSAAQRFDAAGNDRRFSFENAAPAASSTPKKQ